MRSRIPLPSPQDLSPEQAAVLQSILATRPAVDGPFLAWLHAPGLASPAEKLGAYCRFGTGLSPRESELLILLTAARYECAGEQEIHEPIARGAGVSDPEIEALRAGAVPPGLNTREGALLGFAGDLLRTNRVGQATFDAARSLLGVETLVNVTGIVGYYGLVAMTLNAFDMHAD